MGRYSADTEQILGLVGRAKQIGMRVEARITDVEREVVALNVDWDGDAADHEGGDARGGAHATA